MLKNIKRYGCRTCGGFVSILLIAGIFAGSFLVYGVSLNSTWIKSIKESSVRNDVLLAGVRLNDTYGIGVEVKPYFDGRYRMYERDIWVRFFNLNLSDLKELVGFKVQVKRMYRDTKGIVDLWNNSYSEKPKVYGTAVYGNYLMRVDSDGIGYIIPSFRDIPEVIYKNTPGGRKDSLNIFLLSSNRKNLNLYERSFASDASNINSYFGGNENPWFKNKLKKF